ncbi:hypothetical protein EDB81DRAFT_949207 [Dactylonectria macrodidyma]|uniref:C2H2-type domain-containing protein n=1 Tax=Dactylonectria macrodidyma TaxID=307937 RepID=A0A9P9EEN4_9HYPO|nr:hypothetical protein EDB81DRAFT_949207 [Dactylonectria macrodidyma]
MGRQLDFDAWTSEQRALRDGQSPLGPTTPYTPHGARDDAVPLASDEDPLDTNEDVPVDPVLNDLARLVGIWVEGRASEEKEMLVESTLLLDAAPLLDLNREALTGDSATFITFFSTINTTTRLKWKRYDEQDLLISMPGNTSRSGVTSFVSGAAYQDHLQIQQEKEQTQLQCPQCDARFRTKARLHAHRRKEHDSKQCEDEECADKEAFKTGQELHLHQLNVHFKWFNCSECMASTAVFIFWQTMGAHLTTVHGFSDKELHDYWDSHPIPQQQPILRFKH